MTQNGQNDLKCDFHIQEIVELAIITRVYPCKNNICSSCILKMVNSSQVQVQVQHAYLVRPLQLDR